MAKEYIERDDAFDAVMGQFCACSDETEEALNGAIEDIRKIPAADVAPVVHARWIDNGIPGSILSGCSVCGYTCGSSSMNYCPNCGADMREVDDEN